MAFPASASRPGAARPAGRSWISAAGPSDQIRFTTRSARPFSPRTTLSLPLATTFSRTSSSRSRMSVGLSARSFAVFAWLGARPFPRGG